MSVKVTLMRYNSSIWWKVTRGVNLYNLIAANSPMLNPYKVACKYERQ